MDSDNANNPFVNNSFQLGMFTVFITLLVIIFVISPLRKIIYLALFVKLFILSFILYTIYLSTKQITSINTMFSDNNILIGDAFVNKLGLYIYIFLLGLSFIYILKTII